MTKEKETELLALGAEVWRFPNEKANVDLQALMTRLGETEIDSVLVEGGGETVASFLEAELVDKVSFFVAPMLLGGRNAVPAVGGTGVKSISNATRLRNIDVERIGVDILICGYPEWKTG
jgi:diaminohydroxyphosphoribosylaminopyrimidine deaminase/5-amino-6-(5-phosphoribosylamino)uracil reductase